MKIKRNMYFALIVGLFGFLLSCYVSITGVETVGTAWALFPPIIVSPGERNSGFQVSPMLAAGTATAEKTILVLLGFVVFSLTL